MRNPVTCGECGERCEQIDGLGDCCLCAEFGRLCSTCDNRQQSKAEAASERQLAKLYGGDGPVTLDEQSAWLRTQVAK